MRVKPFSPVSLQDFVWAAEYSDGSTFLEFDPITGKPNKFHDIRKKDLIRFGLVGLGYKMYTEVYGGFLVINGQLIEIIYRVNGKDYYLTGQPKMYNDIIAYKDAESIARVSIKGEPSGKFTNRITGFNFGYKTQLEVEDIKFNFRVIYSIPYNIPAYLNFRVVANKKLDGKLVIKKNGKEVAEFEAPLEEGVGGELNWVVR